LFKKIFCKDLSDDSPQILFRLLDKIEFENKEVGENKNERKKEIREE
jgi:hypothetical protein